MFNNATTPIRVLLLESDIKRIDSIIQVTKNINQGDAVRYSIEFMEVIIRHLKPESRIVIQHEDGSTQIISLPRGKPYEWQKRNPGSDT